MSAPSLSTEAGLAGNYPSSRFNARERVLLSSVKAYVDASAGEALAQNYMSVGNSSGVAIDVDTSAGTSASKIRALVKSAVFTVTVASPGVVTSTAHGLLDGDAVSLSTTGALPTNLVASITYYVVSKTTDTFRLSLTHSGAAINTTGTQSGVHTFSASGLSLAPLSVGNADVAAAAAISYSKLNLATSILNADVSASAAIDYSKLATLSSANILVGSAGNVATSVAMSGDTTISNAGVVAIGAAKVLESMLVGQATEGLKAQRMAHGIYNLDAGFGTGAHSLGATLPANAIVTGMWYYVTTTFTSASDAATIALSIEGANDCVTAIAISDVSNPWDSTAKPVEGTPKIETTSTWLVTTQARALVATSAVETLTGGVLHFFVEYMVYA